MSLCSNRAIIVSDARLRLPNGSMGTLIEDGVDTRAGKTKRPRGLYTLPALPVFG